MNGGIDLDTDTIKVALADDSYTPDQDADEFRDHFPEKPRVTVMPIVLGFPVT